MAPQRYRIAASPAVPLPERACGSFDPPSTRGLSRASAAGDDHPLMGIDGLHSLVRPLPLSQDFSSIGPENHYDGQEDEEGGRR